VRHKFQNEEVETHLSCPSTLCRESCSLVSFRFNIVESGLHPFVS